MSVGEEEKRRLLCRHRSVSVSFMAKNVAVTESKCVTTLQWLFRDGAQSITVDDDDDDDEASVASACVLATMLVKISSI